MHQTKTTPHPQAQGQARSTRRHSLQTALALALAASLAPAAWADAYPSKPITIVVPFGAGSGTDQLARILGQALGTEAKVPVVIENKAGASGMIAAQQVAKAAPDGYTVLITTNTTHAANEHLYRKLPYDPVKDFTPVALLSKGHMLLLVAPNSPYKTVEDLLAAARKSPGKINFGSGSSSSRVAGELLTQLGKVAMTHVPYKSNPLGLTDLMGGQIDFMFADAPTALPQVQAGKLRALAVSGTKRLDAVPQLPTVAEAGGPKDFAQSSFVVLAAPKGIAPALRAKIAQDVAKVMQDPDIKTRMDTFAFEYINWAPDEIVKQARGKGQMYDRLIKRKNITLD